MPGLFGDFATRLGSRMGLISSDINYSMCGFGSVLMLALFVVNDSSPFDDVNVEMSLCYARLA